MPQLLCENIYDFDSPSLNELSNHVGREEIKRDYIQTSSSSCDLSISGNSGGGRGSVGTTSSDSHSYSCTETCQRPPLPPPPPPQFSKKLFQLATLKPEQPQTSATIVPPPPPLPPSFRLRTATILSAPDKEIGISTLPPPLPQEPVQPPPPLPDDAETICGIFIDKTSSFSSIEIPNESDVLVAGVEMYPQISQWMAVDAAPPVEVVMEVGMWERHTKGIGGRLLERMGYVR